MFRKSQVLLSIRMTFLHSQKLILLFDGIILNLFHLSFLRVWTVFMLFDQLPNANNKFAVTTDNYLYFLCCFLVKKRIGISALLPSGFTFNILIFCWNNQMCFVVVYACEAHVTPIKYHHLMFLTVCESIQLILHRFMVYNWFPDMIHFGSKSCGGNIHSYDVNRLLN